MLWKTTFFLGFALSVLGEEYAISKQEIKIIHKEHPKSEHGHHGELSHIGHDKPENHEEYAWSYPSYEFSYEVHDPHTHDIKGQKESRDGDKVKGNYWLIQPDGRKRTVTYHADKHSGFHADVHYSDDHHHEPKVEKKDEPEEEKKEEEVVNEEPAAEEGERGAEETRHDVEELGQWIHSRNWGNRGDGKHREDRHHDQANDERELDRRHDEVYGPREHGKRHEEITDQRAHSKRPDEVNDHREYERPHNKQVSKPYMVASDHERKGVEKYKDMDILNKFSKAGNSGHREDNKRAGWQGRGDRHDKDDRREEKHRLPERRLITNNRPAYPIHKTGVIVRENFFHPRYYRQSHPQRKSTHQ